MDPSIGDSTKGDDVKDETTQAEVQEESSQHTYDLCHEPQEDIRKEEHLISIFDETNQSQPQRVTLAQPGEEKNHTSADIQQSELTEIKRIGQGNFGMTFKAKWNSQDVVIKAPKNGLSKGDEEELRTFLQLPSSPNALSIIGVCSNFEHKSIAKTVQAIVVPFQENGDLKKFMQKHGQPNEKQCIDIVLGMARGLAHLHDNNMIHRDLALRNYLVNDEGRVLIADFGLSRCLEDSDPNNPYYRVTGSAVPWRTASPDMLKTKKCTKESDIWAFGIVIWELFHPTLMPFRHARDTVELFALLIGDNFHFSLDYGDEKEEKYPHVLEEAVKLCCDMDASKRPTIHQIIDSLLQKHAPEKQEHTPPESKKMQEAKTKHQELEENLKACVDQKDFRQAQKIQNLLRKNEKRIHKLKTEKQHSGFKFKFPNFGNLFKRNKGPKDFKPNPHPKPQEEGQSTKYKCLLLGLGNSGKSDIFHQLLVSYGRNMSKEDRMDRVEHIYEEIIEFMKTLIYQAGTFEEKEDCQISSDLLDVSKRVMQLSDDAKITPDIAKDIKTLWADSGIQHTFGYRDLFQISHNIPYFFKQVDTLAEADYCPSVEDVINLNMCRRVFHGEIIDEAGTTFKIVDVGGQRSERKGWVKVFQNVKVLLFVSALSEFDTKNDEDITQLQESLKVFDQLVNSKVFKDVPVYLILNKIDLFRTKLKNGTVFDFDDYHGPQDVDDICKFMEQTFKNQSAAPRDIHTEFLTGTEKQLDFSELFRYVRNYYEV